MRYFVGNKIVGSDLYELATVDECLNYFKDIKEIELDTETTGLDPHTDDLLCIQLGTPDRQYVIDRKVIDPKRFKSLLEDTSKTFILQNAKFDLKFFFKYGIYIKKVYDTMLAECILTAGYEDRSVGLFSIVKKYIGVELDKSIRANIQREGLSERVIVYSAEDVKYLTKVKELQMIEINKLQLNNVLDLENEVVKVFALMEWNGVLIDQEKWMEVAVQAEKNVFDLSAEMDEIIKNEPKLMKYIPNVVQLDLFGVEARGLNINWGSPKQKLEILKDLGLKLDSVADKELQRNKKNHVLVEKLIDYSKQAKLASSFGRKFLNFVNIKTGRVHPNYWQILKYLGLI